jgi:hypothetical protein
MRTMMANLAKYHCKLLEMDQVRCERGVRGGEKMEGDIRTPKPERVATGKGTWRRAPIIPFKTSGTVQHVLPKMMHTIASRLLFIRSGKMKGRVRLTR